MQGEVSVARVASRPAHVACSRELPAGLHTPDFEEATESVVRLNDADATSVLAAFRSCILR